VRALTALLVVLVLAPCGSQPPVDRGATDLPDRDPDLRGAVCAESYPEQCTLEALAPTG
jgi:hypothetical protein